MEVIYRRIISLYFESRWINYIDNLIDKDYFEWEVSVMNSIFGFKNNL